MFAIIYRWKLKPNCEQAFQAAWHEGTNDILRLFNSGGSRLHKTSDGNWLAYARWSTEEARDEAFSKGPPSAAVAELQKYILEEIECISLKIVDDLLRPEDGLN